MKKFYTISFCLLAVAAFAQKSVRVKQHRFSFTVESGMMTSFMEVPDGCYACCFGDCFVPFNDREALLQPKKLTSLYLGATANFDINPKHRIGLGVTKGEMGEMEPQGEVLAKQSIAFMGYTVRHQYRVLSGNRMNLYISNAFTMEKPKGGDAFFEQKKGYSHAIGLGCGLKLTKLTEVALNMVGRTSFRGLVDHSYYADAHRFSGGLTLGLTQKL